MVTLANDSIILFGGQGYSKEPSIAIGLSSLFFC